MIKGFEVYFSNSEIEKIANNIKDVLKSGMVIDHTYCSKVREVLKGITNKTFCDFSSSNTMATEILYRIMSKNLYQMKGKKRILFQGNQFVSPVFAARRAGFDIDFIDIELETLGIDLEKLEEETKHNDIMCIMHTGGIISRDIKEIRGVADEEGCFLVEDCAQSFGSKFRGQDSGSFGHFSIFSFASTKIFTSINGGAVLHDDEKIHSMFTQFINCGKRTPFGEQICDVEGFSARLAEIQSAILMGLDINARLSHRKSIAEIYNDMLLKFEGKGIKKIYNPEGTNYYKYMVLLEDPKMVTEIEEFATSNGWELSGPVYRIPTYETPVLSDEFGNMDLPNTEEFSAGHICLPMHENLTLTQAQFVAESLSRYFLTF